MVINNKVNSSTGPFWVVSLGFPSLYGTNLLLVQCYVMYMLSAATVYGNEL